MWETATGLTAFVTAIASACQRDPALDVRHRVLDDGGAVLGGNYVLGERLGRGALSSVYRAHDLELDRPVAVKVLHLETLGAELRRELARLLEREALVAARLNHPNLVTVHRFGMWEGLPFIVVELLSGEPLAARMARGPVPLAEALALVDHVLAGLENAHAMGVMHHALSPRAVFVRADGVVKVLELGMSNVRAVVIGASTACEAVLPGGDTRSMAPELQRGEPTDARADLWAVGTLLEDMLCGPGGRPERDELPRRVAAYLARARAASPADRFPDAAAMRAALPHAQPPRRSRVLAASAACIALAGAIGLGLVARADAGPADSDPRSMMRTRARDAVVVSPDQGPALEGTYGVAGDTTPQIELRRTEHGYRESVVDNPRQSAEVELIRAGNELYLVGDWPLKTSHYYFEQHVEGSDTLVRSFEGWSDPHKPIIVYSTSPLRFQKLPATGVASRTP